MIRMNIKYQSKGCVGVFRNTVHRYRCQSWEQTPCLVSCKGLSATWLISLHHADFSCSEEARNVSEIGGTSFSLECTIILKSNRLLQTTEFTAFGEELFSPLTKPFPIKTTRVKRIDYKLTQISILYFITWRPLLCMIVFTEGQLPCYYSPIWLTPTFIKFYVLTFFFPVPFVNIFSATIANRTVFASST